MTAPAKGLTRAELADIRAHWNGVVTRPDNKVLAVLDEVERLRAALEHLGALGGSEGFGERDACWEEQMASYARAQIAEGNT